MRVTRSWRVEAENVMQEMIIDTNLQLFLDGDSISRSGQQWTAGTYNKCCYILESN